MTPYQKRTLSPLAQRMAGDMRVRNLSPRTIDAYTYHVERFAKHFDKPLDQLGPEEVRLYQLHLIEVRKASWSAFNQAVCGLRFLYHVTLPRPWVVQQIPFGKRPKRLPSVLGSEEVNKRVSPHTLRHSYATGLLEAGVDLLTIGRLLGHKSFTTTLIYLHVRRPHLDSTPSPLDWLPVRQCPRWLEPNPAAPSNEPSNTPLNNHPPTNSEPTRPQSPERGPANPSA